jgi:hypothetical protein
MNKQQKAQQRGKQSTRQLMGIDRLTSHGVQTPKGELVFFLIQPDNLSVLPAEEVRGRVRALSELLRGVQDITLRALDSRESYAKNQSWYMERREKEDNPALRELLRRDRDHLDEIQTMTAASREFLMVCRLSKEDGPDREARIAHLAKVISDYRFRVRVAEEQDVKRLLAVYYQQDKTTEYFENIDGEGATDRHEL